MDEREKIDENSYHLSLNVINEIERLTVLRQDEKITAGEYRLAMKSISLCVYPYVPIEVRETLDRIDAYLKNMSDASSDQEGKVVAEDVKGFGRWS